MTPALLSQISTNGDRRVIDIAGDRYTFFTGPNDSVRSFTAWHAQVPPGGGPPPHVHRREDEAFFVLSGSVTFWANGERSVGSPGTFVSLPRDVPHHFRNETDQPAEMLVIVAPAGLEEMFFRIGQPVTDVTQPLTPANPEQITALLRFAPEFGIEILLPHHD